MTKDLSGQKDHSWRISVRIGNERMTLSIPRDPRVEKCLRSGATKAGTLMSRYAAAYPAASDVQVLSYVALHLASHIEEINQGEASDRTDSRLHDLVELLDKIDDGEA